MTEAQHIGIRVPVKYTVIYFASVLLSLPLLGADGELPQDIKKAVDQRAAAIAKIDKVYLQELEKLKIKYTKLGDLKTGNAIVALIKACESGHSLQIATADDLKLYLRDTVWKWGSDKSGSDAVKMEFYSNGTYNIAVDSNKYPWVTMSSTVVKIVTATLHFSPDYKSFVAETDNGQKRYGARVDSK